MKTTIFALLTLATLMASAAEPQKFSLHYKFDGDHLEVPVVTASYETAIEQGADKCFGFFTSQKKMTKDQKIQLIDVCANPRKS